MTPSLEMKPAAIARFINKRLFGNYSKRQTFEVYVGRVSMTGVNSSTLVPSLPTDAHPSIQAEDASHAGDAFSESADPNYPPVEGKGKKNARTKNLVDFLRGFTNANPMVRFCPDHPCAACQYNQSNDYWYLVCSEKHQFSVLRLLESFDLSLFPCELVEELTYALSVYAQQRRPDSCMHLTFPLPSVVELREEMKKTDSIRVCSKPMDWSFVQLGEFCGAVAYYWYLREKCLVHGIWLPEDREIVDQLVFHLNQAVVHLKGPWVGISFVPGSLPFRGTRSRAPLTVANAPSLDMLKTLQALSARNSREVIDLEANEDLDKEPAVPRKTKEAGTTKKAAKVKILVKQPGTPLPSATKKPPRPEN